MSDCDVQMTPSASSSSVSGGCSPLEGLSDTESTVDHRALQLNVHSAISSGAILSDTVRHATGDIEGAMYRARSGGADGEECAADDMDASPNTKATADEFSYVKDVPRLPVTSTAGSSIVNSSSNASPVEDEYIFKTWAPAAEGPPLTAAHSVGCTRGELSLTDTELTEIHQYLQNVGALYHFQFVSTEKPVVEKRHSTALPGSSMRSAPVGPKPKCAPQLAVQPMYSASSGAACVPRPTIEVPKIKSNPAAVKRLPPWAQRFHRALSSLCRLDACKLFVDEVNFLEHLFASHGKEGKVNKPSYSMDLRTVLSKLEQDLYARQLDVFNDVYCVWLSAYRAYDPGSPMWLSAHEAATLFADQIALHPLRDDFNPPSPPQVQPANKTPKPSKIPGDKSSASVDRILQQIMGNGHQSSANTTPARKPMARTGTDTATGSVAGGSTNTFGNGKGKKSPRANKKPKATASSTSPVNTTELESMIRALLPEQQLQLYSEFRTSACWTESHDGCISLNQDSTSNAACAKMLLWCKKKLNISSANNAATGIQNTAGTETAASAWRKRSAALQQNIGTAAGVPAVKKLKTDGTSAEANPLDVGFYSQPLSSSSLSSSSSSDSSTDSDLSDDSGPEEDKRWGVV